MSKGKIFDSIDNYSTKGFIRPYIIAEAGVNHEGSMDSAKRLIDSAKEGGADAIKFQTYKAESIASKQSPAYWDTDMEPTASQFELFKKHDKFWKREFEELKTYCDSVKIDFMSTPFDVEAARFLNDLVEIFKISSSDITNKPFIDIIASYGKPIILSTGASQLFEIEEAVFWIKKHNVPFALLHCVLNYPTLNKNAHLGMIQGLKKKFPECVIGYSDHTLPGNMDILLNACILGAQVVEKHFTLDKKLPGNDHYHSMDLNDLLLFNKKLDEFSSMFGSQEIISLKSEDIARVNARRSLVAAKDIPAGKRVEMSDLTWKRPSVGISPKFYEELIGRVTRTFIKEDEIIEWNFLC